MSIAINKPQIETGFNRYSYAWEELGIKVDIERLNREGIGEIRVWSNSDKPASLLYHGKTNLLSASAGVQLAKRLSKNIEVDWDTILTYVTSLTMDALREGEPAINIFPDEKDTLEAEYLLHPLLYLRHPAVIFGDYGSAKSLLALVVAAICQLPLRDNPLGFVAPVKPAPCLYLDYEDDASSFRKRWGAIQRGLSIEAMPILYRRMTTPIADSVEEVQRILHNNKIELLIVDSLGPAARGNLNDPEPAIKYHAALRQFGITSLTLAHTAKDSFSRHRTIFGSVYFTNLTRAVWEVKAAQEVGEDMTTISLKHTKGNLSRLHLPLGYRFTFTNNTIGIDKANLNETALSGELPLSLQIKKLLGGQGALPVKEIAEALEANEPTVRTAINRLAQKKEVRRVGEHSWGLSTNETYST